MTRIKQGIALSLIVAGAVLAACSDNTEPNPCDPFEGTWNATTFTYTLNADPNVVVDVRDFGASIQLTADDNCSYTGSAVIPPATTAVDLMGTFTLGDGTLTLNEQIVTTLSQTFDYTLNGNTLTLVNDDSSFDFNQDGEVTAGEAATLTIVLTRS